MIAIAIDDEPSALHVISSFCNKIAHVTLAATFTDPFEAVAYLQIHRTDLLFLDVLMPDISGLELYRSLRSKPMVIVTTAFEEYALAGFEISAVDYLLKPFSIERFITACNKAFSNNQMLNDQSKDNALFIQTATSRIKINLSDIYFIEAAANYVSFHLETEQYSSRMTFQEVVQLLPEKLFCRVHRSFIVAINKVESVEKHQLRVNKHVIPISDGYYQTFLSLFKSV
ncbi:MAG: LytTR family DNA-binding domain-containing protein [Bacteroidota bacterium]